MPNKIGSIEKLELEDMSEQQQERIGDALLLAQLNEKHNLVQWCLADLRNAQARIAEAAQQFKAIARVVQQATGANVDYLDASTRTHDWNPATGNLVALPRGGQQTGAHTETNIQ